MGRAATNLIRRRQPGNVTSFLLTVSYPGGESATSSLTVEWAETPPNRAPVVNRWAEWQFAGKFNAPRGYLITRTFTGMFSDPDGDDLTYSVSVPEDQRSLVESLDVHLGITGSNGEPVDFLSIMVEAEADWKAISPALPDPLTFTVTLTATDPGGLSASVSTDYFTDWESHPELVSAVAGRQMIELSFEQELQANPGPAADQFTVNVTNEDGSTATIAVSGVSIDGKGADAGAGLGIGRGPDGQPGLRPRRRDAADTGRRRRRRAELRGSGGRTGFGPAVGGLRGEPGAGHDESAGDLGRGGRRDLLQAALAAGRERVRRGRRAHRLQGHGGHHRDRLRPMGSAAASLHRRRLRA